MWRVCRGVMNLRQARRFSVSVAGPCIVHKRGTDILHDPWFNKDTGFPLTERDRLGLRGLLPPRVISFEQQYERFMNSYHSLEHNTRGEPPSVVALAKWRILNRLHDRNETLYYRVLIDNIKDFAPVIYTPTVGLVCQNYGGLYRRPRGMYFSAKDKGEMMSMIYNWPAKQVDMIVITDGSRILGLGDLGVQGIGIPIGKLDMYVAAAGMIPKGYCQSCLMLGPTIRSFLKITFIFPCRPYQGLYGCQKNAAALCSFTAAQSSRGVKHQAEIAQSTAAEKDTKAGGEVSDKHSLEPDLLDTRKVVSFSPLEGAAIGKRASALTKESSKIKIFELSQKTTFALIPALLLVSKNSLTTSLLIFSVYWQIYGFFKEIFLDYVHHEVTRKWVLIYFQLLLLILGKETVLLLNLV